MKDWLNFVTILVAVALATTAGIALGVPRLRASADADPMSRRVLNSLEAATVLPRSFMATRSAAPAPSPRPTPPPAAAVTPSPPSAPPPPKRPRKPAAPQGTWGVVCINGARTYSPTGKFLGRLKSGSVVRVAQRFTSGDDEFAACMPPDSNDDTITLIRTGDLSIFPGTPASVPPDIRALRIREGTLLAQLHETTKAFRHGVRADNPHAKRFAACRKSYRAFWERVDELQALRDNAEDDETRAKCFDELRTMKGDDIRLGRAFEAIKSDYDKWNAGHPIDADQIPGAAPLRDELAQVRRRIDEHDTTH